MAASNTRFTQNSLGQSKTPIDSDHGIYRDLRNVVAKYPFERSHRFLVIQPNSGYRAYSRSSCAVGEYAPRAKWYDPSRHACDIVPPAKQAPKKVSRRSNGSTTRVWSSAR